MFRARPAVRCQHDQIAFCPFGIIDDYMPGLSELGLDLTPLEDGLRETYRWYQQQRRPQPDFSWEDRLLASA